MADRYESLLTALLLAPCLILAAVSLLPRVLVSHASIGFDAPDIDVAVDGAVVSPGVYRLPFRSRVADALALAGGLSDDAETTLVNPAASLGPGDRVFVPSRYREPKRERVSINSAPPAELESLPGVGPVMAARIVAGRPYSRLEDLLRVRGIGEKTLERLKEHARL